MRDGQRPPDIYIRLHVAEIKVARGLAYWATDGTRHVIERYVRPRGDHREWRKTICYDPDTRSSMPTMQLVPLGRPRRAR